MDVLGCTSFNLTYFLLPLQIANANFVGGVEATIPNIIVSLFLWMCWVALRLTQPTFYCKIRIQEHSKYLLVTVTSALQLARDDLSVTILLSLVQSQLTE